ncbi:hypothetical protein B7463_g4810, partial [Scytalidium lignicola]
MDDPWGSPWADEGPNAISKPQNVIVKPASPARGSPIGENVNSPWDDEDDGFGDWSVAPEPGLSNTAYLEIKLGQGSDAENGTSDLLAPKKDIEQPSPAWGHESPLPLESDLKLSSIPTLQLEQGQDAQPPPDPWAAGKENGATPTLFEEQNVAWQDSGARDSDIERQDQSASADQGPTHSNVDTLKLGNEETTEDDEEEEEALPPPIQLPLESEQVEKTEHDSSRPSSSDNSHRDDRVLSESPRTSIDEPGKPRVIRKVSSKVKVLVEHFDGLAVVGVPATVESMVPGEGPEVPKEESPKPEEEVDGEGDDFGDFEEGMSESGDTFDTSPEGPSISSPEANSTKQIITGAEDFKVLEEHAPVQFGVDVSLLRRLFPDLETTEPPSTNYTETFISDIIPQDTFSTTEERKVWYRISRYGTMRQYNSGDDENYTRVDWNHSKVREDTLKIVAKWMEEDRISGRVTLGGSNKGSALFGWDNKKAAVPISTAFASKRGSEKTKIQIPPEPKSSVDSIESPTNFSKPTTPLKERRRSSVASPLDVKAKVPVPVAQFSWNSVEDAKPVAKGENDKVGDSSADKILALPKLQPVVQPTPIVEQQPAKPKPSALILAENDKVTTLPVVFAASPSDKILPPIIPPTIPPSEDPDDDDWGEMVSSPIVTSQSPLPLPGGQHHEKSISISGTASFHNPHPSSLDPRDVLRRGHKTTASLGDILIPSTKTPLVGHSKPPLTASLTSAGFPDFFSSSPSNTPTSTMVTSTTSAFDPWASADFSIFEKPSAAPPKPSPPTFTKPSSRGMTNTSKRPMSFAAPFTSSPLRNQQSPAEVEQDEIFRKIIAGLPDLSYMMRR